MPSLTLTHRWIAILTCCFLTACGGGGGGGGGGDTSSSTAKPDTGESPAPAGPNVVNLSGSAVKGVVANAQVTAYLINEDGTRGALLGSSRTGEDGSYSLNIPAQRAPVWVELSEAPGAFMVCDNLQGCGEASDSEKDVNQNGSVDFGEKMLLPRGFTLRALLPHAQSAKVPATLSPLTHLAAVLAEQSPQGVDGLTVAMANSQVANLFTLDANILSLKLPDVTQQQAFDAANAKQRKYAVLLGAFAAMSNNGDFAALLQDAVQQFRNSQGQLPNRSDDSNPISLSRWAEKAVVLARHLKDEKLAAAFAALVNAAQLAENGQTNATPDSSVSSNELDAVKTLLGNVYSLRGTLDVTSVDSPLPAFSPLISASEEVSESTSAIAHGSRLASYVAVPKLALTASCNSISNVFTAYLCRSIVANKSLDEICTLTLSNLSIGGKTLCEYLNSMRLPAGNGLVADLALMDGLASVHGETGETRVDMQLSRGMARNGNQVSMDWTAELDSTQFGLVVPNGKINYQFEDLLGISSLNNPQSVESQFQAQLALKSDQVSRFSGSANTSVDFTHGDTPVSNTRLSGVYTDSVGQTSNMSLTMTQEQSFGSTMAVNVVHPEDGRNITVSLARSSSGDSIRMQWPGHTVNAVTRTGDSRVSINNGGAVTVDLNLAAREGEPVGTVKYNGKSFGDVQWLDDGLVVKLPNGQTAQLY